MEQIKQKISTKILDIVDGLPRFRKGVISNLQDIRERQRRWSSKSYERRKAPENASVELNQITLVLTFEHEDFGVIQKGLKKYFSKNEKIEKFIRALKDSEDKLHAASWHSLGYISRVRSGYMLDVEVDGNLPSSIMHVSLSYHRVLPSVACIIFEFSISGSVSTRLRSLQGREYLDSVVFKRLWPLNRLHHSYSMDGGNGQGYETLCKEKDIIRGNLEKWIVNGFNWNGRAMEAVAYVDVYKISGNPKNPEGCKKWLHDNSQWLQDFNISIRDFDTYKASDFIFSNSRRTEAKYKVSDVVAKIESDNESEFGDFLEFKVRAIVISSTLFNLIEKYQGRVERLRAKGIKVLYKGRKPALKRPGDIQDLKILVIIISRLQHELKQYGNWISHSISEIGQLQNFLREKPFDLGKNTMRSVKYQLNQVKTAAEIVDTGLTNYLSVQSIYVMYKLQRWMFILSVVVTLATIVGVLLEWENLKKLVTSWINA